MTLKKVKSLTLLILIVLLGIGLILSINSTLEAFSGIHTGVYQWLKSLIYEEDKSFWGLFMQVTTGVLFLCLTFMFYLLFSSGLSLFFSGKSEGFMRALGWQLYKYANVFLPVVIVSTVAAALISVSIFFFNTLMTVSGISIGIVSFISTFAGLNIIFFSIFAIIFSLWLLLKFNYGTEIALNEPELNYKTIALKAKKFSVNLPLISVYLVFIAFFIMQLTKVNESTIFPLLFLNIISYAGIKYLKTSAYVKSRV